MQSATLLREENKTLRAANEKVKKKRVKKRTYVGRGGVLTPTEALERTLAIAIEVEIPIIESQAVIVPLVQRAPRLCSICRSSLHIARTCSG